MPDNRKYHFNVGEVKSKILEIILEAEGPIKEPNIRESLSEKIGVIDQSTVNKHLKYLKDKECIEKVSPLEKSRLNYWDIRNFEQLKNIRSEFKNIKLNKHEKAIILILNKNGYEIKYLQGFFIYIQLLLSDSFFTACIDTSMGTLYSRIGNIYNYKNALRVRTIAEWFEESYNAYTNRYLSIEISKEEFSNVLTEMAKTYKEITSMEAFTKLWKEKMQKFSTKKCDEIVEEIIKDEIIYIKIKNTIELIWIHSKGYNELFFSLLFEGFFYQDNLLGVSSKEEISFALETKANYDEYKKSYSNTEDYRSSFKKMALEDLKQASIVMHDKKHPSLFDKKIYDDQDDIYHELCNYFEGEIQEVSESID